MQKSVLKLKKIHHPNSKTWKSYYIVCVKDKFGLNDDRVRYVFGFTISTDLKGLDKEYLFLANALANEDGDFLNRFFSSFYFKEIRIQCHRQGNYESCLDLTVKIEIYYTGEKWGLVHDFFIDVWDHEKRCYLEGENNEFYFLSEYPMILADALNFFNALSFENTTHLIKLQIMWDQLNKIRDLCFKVPKYEEDDDILFVRSDLFTINPRITKNVDLLIRKINSFQNTYQIERQDYFGVIREHIKPEDYDERCERWYKNAFEGYLGRILDSYTDKLKMNNLISACERCGNVFKFSKTKKYCSFLQDGHDCGKIMRNRRFYQKHKDKILLTAYKNTAELRQFYKEKGVKK